MSQMHQLVVLTSHEVSPDLMRKMFNLLARHESEVGYTSPWTGTAFKLKATIELPEDEQSGLPAIGPQNIVPIYGELAQ